MKWISTGYKTTCIRIKLITAQLFAIILIVLTSSSMNLAVADNTSEEKNLIKAAFIYNFAKFTNWPEDAWKSHDAPMNLCIAGKDQLIEKIKHLENKTIKGRPIQVHKLDTSFDSNNCHLLYVATSYKNNYKYILKTIKNNPVLTVSEIKYFSRSDGIIELYNDKGRNRFIINLGNARLANLAISSRLLNLATIVNYQEAP